MLQDLDTLPFSHRPYDPELIVSFRTLPLLASRGCARRCSFCSIHTFYRTAPGKTVRIRSAARVVEEMRMLYDERGVRVFLFQDDDFPLWGRAGAKWVDELAHRLRAADLAERVLWKINCRAEYVEPELFAPLASSGRSSGTVRRPPSFCRMLPYGGTPIREQLAREGRLRGNVMHPDYDFLGRRLNAYHQLLGAAAKHWIHNEGISHQLNWAWDEFFTARRLAPGLTGVPAYDRRCAGCLRGPARPTAATAQRLRAGQRRCAGRRGHGRRRARTGDGAAGALTLTAVKPGVC